MSEDLASDLVKIAIVGMTGSGKTVLITTLAMKMAQMSLEDIYLAPFGKNRRQTLRYTQSNWQTLNNGQWPQSTPAGELIELQWELTTKNCQASVQFLDSAGQDIRSLFNDEDFDPDSLEGDLKRVFDSVNSANVLIFLVNMKDLLATSDATAEILDMDQMFHTLQQRNDIPRRMAVAFSQYDKYKPEVDQKFNGDFLQYVRHYLPYLYGQYKRFQNFEMIPVAAVNDTQNVIEDGEIKQYPVPFFSSYNLETLIYWIADSVEQLAVEVAEAQKLDKLEKERIKEEQRQKREAEKKAKLLQQEEQNRKETRFGLIILSIMALFFPLLLLFAQLVSSCSNDSYYEKDTKKADYPAAAPAYEEAPVAAEAPVIEEAAPDVPVYEEAAPLEE